MVTISSQEPRGRARLVDVAERSGVTKSIVSRVINGDTTLRIRPETRTRILRIADDLGYRPHAGARALSLSRTGVLALLIPDLSNSVYAAVTRGAYRQARELGYAVLLAEDTADVGGGDDYAELVISGRVDGLLVASARADHPLVDRLLREPDAIAHVFVNREVPGSHRNVGLDMAGASAAAVDHLVAHGHRHIAMTPGPPELTPAQARLGGFRARLEHHGLSPEAIASGDFSEAGGYTAAREILTRWPSTTALYTSTFVQAIGAMQAARSLGRRLPHDLSIITYDDSPMADYLEPRLTTVAMPLAELGATAVDLLVEQLASGQVRDLRIEDGFRIVERDSVVPPTR
ncbi:LacI family DNA-binding transcriptional regulator [Actinotalea sp.]|uniref:LacI family DNA-binding transcriptional regulator n=1 Tax=Actinotalea sp. TaxID=1872145 RepID=UPI0035620CEB